MSGVSMRFLSPLYLWPPQEGDQVHSGKEACILAPVVAFGKKLTFLARRTLCKCEEICGIPSSHPFRDRLTVLQKLNGPSLSVRTVVGAVLDFNQTQPPQPFKAGCVVCSVPCCTGGSREAQAQVLYNSQGWLDIAFGPVGPMNLLCSQTLDDAQVKQVRECYQRLSLHLPYNNLGELLEFIHYAKHALLFHPRLSLKAIHRSYHPDPVAMFEKYRSGACVLLASAFCEKLRKEGIYAQVLAESGTNFWSVLPIPGTANDGLYSVRWDAFVEAIYGACHASVFLPFREADSGRDSALYFACSLQENSRSEVECLPLSAFLCKHDVEDVLDRPNQIFDISHIAKQRLLGRFKALIKRGQQVFGIDFLRGNLFMNSAWDRENLPLDKDGYISIQLEDLARPEQRATYYIRKQPVELSHREALKKLLEALKRIVAVPPTMEEDLIALASYAPRLMSEFFLPQLPLMKAVYSRLLPIGKRMSDLREQEAESECTPPASLLRHHQDLVALFDDICSSIAECNQPVLEESMLRFNAALLRSPERKTAAHVPV